MSETLVNNIAKEFSSLNTNAFTQPSGGGAPSGSFSLPKNATPGIVDNRTPEEKNPIGGFDFGGINRDPNADMRTAAEDALLQGMQGNPGGQMSIGGVPRDVASSHPGINQPILKGMVAGKYPVFAAGGGIFPTQLLDRRRQVTQSAANKQRSQSAAKGKAFEKIDGYDPIEQSLNDVYFEGTQEIKDAAFKKWGKYAPQVLGNRNSEEFMQIQQLDQKMRTLGDLTNTVYTQQKEAMENVVKGDQYASKEMRARMNEYRTGSAAVMNSIRSGDLDQTTKELQSYMQASTSVVSMLGVYDDYFNNTIRADIEEGSPEVSVAYAAVTAGNATPEQKEIVSTKMEKMLRDGRLDIWANQVYAEHETDANATYSELNGDEKAIKGQIKDEIGARFGFETKLNWKTINNGSRNAPKNAYHKSDDGKFWLTEVNPQARISQFSGGLTTGFTIGGPNSDLNNMQFNVDKSVWNPVKSEWQHAKTVTMDHPMLVYGTQNDDNNTPTTGWYVIGDSKQYMHSNGQWGKHPTDLNTSYAVPVYTNENGATTTLGSLADRMHMDADVLQKKLDEAAKAQQAGGGGGGIQPANVPTTPSAVPTGYEQHPVVASQADLDALAPGKEYITYDPAEGQWSKHTK
jgi:hypothetical protein